MMMLLLLLLLSLLLQEGGIAGPVVVAWHLEIGSRGAGCP
jgi:hypothetical protein